MSNSASTPINLALSSGDDEKAKMTTGLRMFQFPLRILMNKVPTPCFAGYTNFYDSLEEDLCFNESTGERTDASYGKLIYRRIHIYDWLVARFGPLTAEGALNCLTIGEPEHRHKRQSLCHDGKTLKELVDAGTCSDAGRTIDEVLCQSHTRRIDPGTLFETKESDGMNFRVFRLGANGLFSYGPSSIIDSAKSVRDWLTFLGVKDCPHSESECHKFFYCVKTGKSLLDMEHELE